MMIRADVILSKNARYLQLEQTISSSIGTPVRPLMYVS
jgi:hypothetical protein